VRYDYTQHESRRPTAKTAEAPATKKALQEKRNREREDDRRKDLARELRYEILQIYLGVHPGKEELEINEQIELARQWQNAFAYTDWGNFLRDHKRKKKLISPTRPVPSHRSHGF